MSAHECFSAIHYNWGDHSWDEFIERIKAVGVIGIELLHTDLLDRTPADVRALRRRFDDCGVIAAAVGVGNDFCHPLGSSELGRQVDLVRRRAEQARELGTNVLRLEGGIPKPNVPTDGQWPAISDCVERCIPIADDLDCLLAVDTHGLITNRADELADTLDRIDHARVGSCIDPSNLRWFGHSVARAHELVDRLIPRCMHVHLKNGDGSTGAMEAYTATALDEGELDIGRIIRSLVESGYRGAWCLEYEGPPPTDAGVARGVAFARGVLAECGISI
ncbi:MAG: sugar phosphate isomerase/epimerase [Phycisphaerales bacterium]|nr:sugar phosphate isomerase/epimerase [Phycisphaerales bacterium]